MNLYTPNQSERPSASRGYRGPVVSPLVMCILLSNCTSTGLPIV
jgi:hypothetical protein